jgi:spore coat polysaccharide biosynthesis protein SpsF
MSTDKKNSIALVVILARLTSSRLPKKHLRLINGKPLIWHVISRVNKIKAYKKIVLATGPLRENKELIDYVRKFGVEVFSDEDVNDVSGRVAKCSKHYNKDIIVTISGDCPLIDPEFIDKGIALLNDEKTDFVYVNHSKYKCLHEGIEFHTLNTWRQIDDLSVTWFHKEHPGSVLKEKKWMFNGSEIIPELPYRRHDFRMSVDTRSDLLFMNEIYKRLEPNDNIVDLQSVVTMMDTDSNLMNINAHVHQKTIEEKSRTFMIITHASKEIGMGHLSRSIAIATELQESHAVNIVFYVNNDQTAELLNKEGFRCFTDYVSPNTRKLKKLIDNYHISCLILDLRKETLHLEFSNISKLRVEVVLIDNTPPPDFGKVMSIIPAIDINGNEQKNVFKGKKYIILKREINYLRNNYNKRKADQITILSGGSNIPNDRLLKALSGLNNCITFKFIIGPYSNKDELELSLENYNIDNYIIKKNPHNILNELHESKMILTPFGVTAYEAIALGTPVLIYNIIHQKDKRMVDYLLDNDIVFNGSDIDDPVELGNMISKLYNDHLLLEYKAKKAYQFMDGLGVARVAAKITGLLFSHNNEH